MKEKKPSKIRTQVSPSRESCSVCSHGENRKEQNEKKKGGGIKYSEQKIGVTNPTEQKKDKPEQQPIAHARTFAPVRSPGEEEMGQFK